MSPREVGSWLTRHSQIIVYIVTLGFGAGLAMGAVESKVDKITFEVHEEKMECQYEAIMDVICADKPSHRRCR